MDEIFGEAKEPQGERPLKVLWPLHSVNVIEGELTGRMVEAMQQVESRAPVIFLEDNEFSNAAEWEAIYGPVTAHEAIALQGIVYGEVQERFRRQLICARECNGTMDDYLLRCEAEGIHQILERKTP